jgi:signal transduction histidine kinase
MKLRLAHKVLLLIAVPIVFQFGFLVLLGAFLAMLDHYQDVEHDATEALQISDRIHIAFHQRLLLYGMYRATHNKAYEKNYRDNDASLDSDFKRLGQLWEDDPLKINALNSMRRANMSVSQFASTMMVRSGKEEYLSDLMGGPMGMLVLRRYLNQGQEPEIEQVLREVEESQVDAERRMKNIARNINYVLIFGALFSVITSIASGLLFSSSITERLKRVLRNIRSMESRQPAVPIADGFDEIADLDSAITRTAKQIRDAEDFQSATARIVAQELERPLDTIAMAFEQLRTTGFDNLNAKGASRLQEVNAEVDRLRKLVDDLLVLDTIRSAGYDLNIQQFDLADTACEAARVVLEFASSRNISIECHTESSLAYGDPQRVLQVAVNLLSNAIKFSAEQSIVEVSTRTNENGMAELLVKDTGAGIPEDFQSRIFGRFQQALENRAIEKKGSGLGLAICKRLVEAQHGQMGFTSAIGAGSTFWLSLPVNPEMAPPVAATAPARASRGSGFNLQMKGLALVLLPLGVQLITIGALWLILNSATDNISELTRSRELASMHTEIVKSMVRETYFSMLVNAADNPEDRTNAKVEETKLARFVGELRTISGSNAELLANCGEMDKMVARLEKLLKEVRDADPDMTAATWFGAKRGAETEKLLTQTQVPLEGAMRHQAAVVQSRTLAQSDTRHKLELILVCSALLSALVSGGLGLLLVKSLTRRAQLVVSNTVRLRDRQPLAEPIAGDDELAFVDRAFYDAANKLIELERFKQELVSITSHELRTPLTSLLAFADLVGAGVFGTLSEAGENMLNVARSQVSELIAIITNLLDSEKKRSSKLETKFTQTVPD